MGGKQKKSQNKNKWKKRDANTGKKTNGERKTTSKSSQLKSSDKTPTQNSSSSKNNRSNRSQNKSNNKYNASSNKNKRSNNRNQGENKNRGSKSTSSSNAKVGNKNQNREEKKESLAAPTEDCPVCTNPMEFVTVGNCGHKVCSECSLRIRSVLRSKTCPLCKGENESLVVYRFDHPNPPEVSDMWEGGGGGVDEDHVSKMQFVDCRDHFQASVALRSIVCPLCPPSSSPFASIDDLVAHTSSQHDLEDGGRTLCELCLLHRPLFVPEQRMFEEEAEFERHQEEDHITCPLCLCLFFDKEVLVNHLSSSHLTCHICTDTSNPRFFGSREDLRDHFSSSHLLCPYCQENEEEEDQVAVFPSTIQLNHHLASVHHLAPSMTSISLLNFRVKPLYPQSSSSSVGSPVFYFPLIKFTRFLQYF